ncbi:synaptic vesicle glycoprotein 2C [Parasteatoda tepidariorum]|uniref:synaptic vesicle glycoprotein 2C n=1 Tax=Parasteatoda tepidariorum TaxID=114398 RepID=UPI00077FB8E7|nr:synaptic vesicle glycoprotein 2C [Parasteatoda tepidariorum]
MTLETQKDDSECACLVREETLPAGANLKSPEQPKYDTAKDALYKGEEEEEEIAGHQSIAKFHEQLLEQAGFGAFHLLVLLMAGLGLAADAVELFAIGYIIPSAEHELCMEESQKGWLGTISFIGMTIGALLWGIMGDRLGRRRTLLTALATNGIFGVIAAFMPTYSLLMLTRFFSSIGIGGSLPIVFTFYSEFLVRKSRGKHLSFLLVFWALGGLFVAVLAWGIIPKSGATIMDTKRLHFGRWRKFLLICSIPAIISAVGTTFLPESPRFLLEMGRNSEALYVYKQIFSWNNAVKSGEEYQLTEMEIPGRRPTVHINIPPNRGILREMLRSMEMCWSNISKVFASPNTYLTVLLLILWTTASFGFYGISIWLHEYTKVIEDANFDSRSLKQTNLVIEDISFNNTIENVHFSNLTFVNVRFIQTLINHCSFHNCSFINCTFSNIRTSKTYFKFCDFYQTEFFDTDLFKYKFQFCTLVSSYFFNTKGGCELDFDINFKLSELFYENLFAQLAILPGALISSFILDRIGRVKTLGVSLLLSGCSVPFLWLATRKEALIAFEAVFTFLSVFGWNAIDVISTEAYPANIRTTSYGIFSAISRITAILSNLTFGSTVEASKIIPIVISSTVLISGALCVTRLPETKDYLV